MRMTRAISQRIDLRDEQGAVLALVGIALVAIIGIAVLSVDLGGIAFKKRALVNANDAAALAAAQTCARNLSGSEDPAGKADGFATSNVPNAVRDSVTISPSCTASSGSAAVQYHAPQPLLFAPILGLSNSATVTAQATAIWGVAQAGNIPPVMVTGPGLASCNFTGYPGGPPANPEQQCTLTYPKLGNGQWGGLNLSMWDVCGGTQGPSCVTTITSSCGGASASSSKGWMNNNPGPMTLRTPIPTYVCADNGQTTSTWSIFNSLVGQIRYFPVTDPANQVPIAPASPAAYDVVAFEPQRIVSYMNSGSDDTLTHSWPGPQSGGINPCISNCVDYGLRAIRLSQ
jgi:Flp pilus assembly protein TadG